MRIPPFKAFLIPMALTTAFAINPAQADSHEPPALNSSTQPAENRSLAVQVQQIFNITPQNTDILHPLAETLKALATDPVRAEKPLDQLVTALNEGPAPDALNHLLIEQAHINSKGEEKEGWKYGTSENRRSLILHIGKKGDALAKASPKRAADYYRAVLLMAAEDSFTNSGMVILFATPNGPLVSAGYMTEAQAQALDAMAKRYNDSHRPSAVAQGHALMAIWNLAKNKKKTIPPEALANAIHLLKQARPLAFNEEQQYRLCDLTWRLLNLARLWKDESAIQAIKSLMIQWQKESPDTPLERWLKEAMETEGSPPSPAVSR